MKNFILFVVFSGFFLALPQAVLADGKGFTQAEKDIIRIVFDEIADRTLGPDGDDDALRARSGKKNWGKHKGLPPGLAKRDELPPGLEKQLKVNGALPPGLAKRDLPYDLRKRLPKARSGTERKIIGNDVVLIETATGVILDILRGVVRD